MKSIDLNADVGEGGDDAPLFAVIRSANIACGGHAGDAATMRTAVGSALAHGVALGAHPSYPDRVEFGRRTPAAVDLGQLLASLQDQVRVLHGIAVQCGGRLRHCKPHGALYHDVARSPELACAVATAVTAVVPGLRFVVLAGSPAERCLRDRGVPVLAEGFADRAYDAEGGLVPRSEPGAVLGDPAAAAAQAVAIARRGGVDTLCVHGDTPGALAIARAVSAALVAAGFTVGQVE